MIANQPTEYNPTIQSLVEHNAEHWGDQEANRERLIPYGIRPIDKALYGLDPAGEFIVIQGEEKNRKTTLVTNILTNFMTWGKLKVKPHTNIDTLESGMRPEKYKDVLLSMLASKVLMSFGHRPHEHCPACDASVCRELGITYKFLRFNKRSAAQKEAIDVASDILYQWPLTIHGASIRQGNTRSLADAVAGDKKQTARWIRLIEEYGMQILVVDHVQQYAFADEPTDYEKQVRAVSAIGDFVSQYGVTCLMLSQVSLTSVREVKASGGKLVAAGGSKAAQEANTVFSVAYKPNSGVMRIKIEESRDAGTFSVWQRLEDQSGVFYGEASTEPII